MKSIILALTGACALAFATGCATVTRGTNQVLEVESTPSGAKVTLSNGMTGTTPTSFKVPRKNALVVTIEREGYETLVINVNPGIEGEGAAGMAGNVIIGGVIGIGVDAVSGATMSLRPNPVSVILVPLDGSEQPELEEAEPLALTIQFKNDTEADFATLKIQEPIS